MRLSVVFLGVTAMLCACGGEPSEKVDKEMMDALGVKEKVRPQKDESLNMEIQEPVFKEGKVQPELKESGPRPDPLDF